MTYHNSFPNFAKHFGLNVIGYVEPRPGIPPTPSHTIELIGLMKRENCKLILVEPYFDLKTPQPLLAKPEARSSIYLPSVGGEKDVTDYFKLFDYDIGLAEQGIPSDAIGSRRPMEILPFLIWPFVASLILTGIHAYLGVHVVERGVIFVDLALAQIAALGATIAILVGMDPHGRGAYWLSLGFTFRGRGDFCLRAHAARAYSAGSLYRHRVCRRLGCGHSGHEQGHRRDRAPQRHAGREHPRVSRA